MHFTERAWLDDEHRDRRFKIRLGGFVSAHAPLAGSELVTKPLTFRGQQLVISDATSAAGSLCVEIQDERGKAPPGFSLQESTEHFGDSIEQVISGKAGSDVSSLAGKPVRLRFGLQDANLYSLRFRER